VLKINGYEVPKHTSFSSITTWLSCGYRYYLSRVVQVEEQPATWSIGGTAVHSATEEYDRIMWKAENR